MKKSKKIIVLCLSILTISLLTLLVNKADLENGLFTNGDEVESGDEILDKEDAESISWTYKNSTLSFTKEGDEWVYDDDEMFPLDSEMIDDIVDFYCSARSDMIIENVTDLSEYGLKNPDTTITIDDVTMVLGDETRIGGEYYLTMDNQNVYLIDEEVITMLDHEIEDFLKKEETPDSNNPVSLTLSRKEDTLELVHETESGKAYSDEYEYFSLDSGNYTTLDNSLSESFMKTAGNIDLGDCVDYDARDHLDDYGLSEPDMSISYIYMEEIDEEKDENGEVIKEAYEEERTFDYEISKKDDQVYIHIKDSDIVYKGTDDLYESLSEKTVDDLLPGETLLLDFDEVAKIEVTLDGETFSLTSSSTKKKDEEIITWSYDGHEIETEDLFDSLNNIAVVERGEDYKTKGTEISFKFYRHNNSSVSISFYKYNSEYCVSELNLNKNILVSRSLIVDLKESINAIILKDYSETD